MTNVTTIFNQIVSAINVTVVEFDESWHNGTGYLNRLTDINLGLEVGTRFKSFTNEARQRSIVGVVTPVGNVFFFEHHDRPDSIICVQRPWSLRGMFTSGVVDNEEMIFNVMGGVDGSNYNLGKTLELVIQKSRIGKRHPADLLGYDKLSIEDHQKAALMVADRLAEPMTDNEAEAINVSNVWCEVYHQILLAQDFAGDEVSIFGKEFNRHPSLTPLYDKVSNPRQEMFEGHEKQMSTAPVNGPSVKK